MFDCQCLVSTYHIWACQLLVVSHYEYPCLSLVCPIWILINLTSYCLQLLWALSLSSMLGLMQYSLTIFPLSLSFRVSCLSDGQVVVVTPSISIALFAASLFSLITMCAGTLHSVIFLSCAWSSARISHIQFSIKWKSYCLRIVKLGK